MHNRRNTRYYPLDTEDMFMSQPAGDGPSQSQSQSQSLLKRPVSRKRTGKYQLSYKILYAIVLLQRICTCTHT